MQTLQCYSLASIETYLSGLLGGDPPEARPEKYVEALKGIGIEGVRKFILELLENGIPRSIVENSYFHPNKFFKLGICRLSNCVKLRLHFWNKNQLEAKTPIHSHAWDYASLLIAGSYLHDTFNVIDLNREDVEKLKENPSRIPETYFSLYKIPKRNSAEGKFQPVWEKYVEAERRSRRIENEGSIYFLGMEHPHQITIDLQKVGSMVTLVLTSVTDRENLFTLQPIFRSKSFDNPSPNVDEGIVRNQLELILNEISKPAV